MSAVQSFDECGEGEEEEELEAKLDRPRVSSQLSLQHPSRSQKEAETKPSPHRIDSAADSSNSGSGSGSQAVRIVTLPGVSDDAADGDAARTDGYLMYSESPKQLASPSLASPSGIEMTRPMSLLNGVSPPSPSVSQFTHAIRPLHLRTSSSRSSAVANATSPSELRRAKSKAKLFSPTAAASAGAATADSVSPVAVSYLVSTSLVATQSSRAQNFVAGNPRTMPLPAAAASSHQRQQQLPTLIKLPKRMSIIQNANGSAAPQPVADAKDDATPSTAAAPLMSQAPALVAVAALVAHSAPVVAEDASADAPSDDEPPSW
jgi:hypothetical protein